MGEAMGQIGYAAAFLGGVLTLVSPCGALLLPSFFAYAFGDGTLRLAGRTLVFLLGMCTLLVPLGFGAALLTGLLYRQQELVTAVTGGLLIGFGALVVAGGGFAFPWPPGGGRLRRRWAGGPPVGAGTVPVVFVLGMVSGVGGFCSGPILGSVLTLAAQSGQAVRGGVLLALYAAGMAAPLFLLALLWDRYDLGRRGWLRGRGVRIGRLRTHTTALISGLLLVGLGVLFLTTSGTQALPAWFGGTGEGAARVEEFLLRIQPYVPDLAFVGVAAGALLFAGRRLLRRP